MLLGCGAAAAVCAAVMLGCLHVSAAPSMSNHSASAARAPRDEPITHPVTLVTAYFPLKQSKHSHAEYDEWISNFFGNIETPIVLFTTTEVHCRRGLLIVSSVACHSSYPCNNMQAEAHMRMLRGDLPMTVVTDYASPFDLPPLRGMEEIYIQQHEIDPEKSEWR